MTPTPSNSTAKYRLTAAAIRQMERDHRLDSACAVLGWLNEAGHVHAAWNWYLGKVVPLLMEALAA